MLIYPLYTYEQLVIRWAQRIVPVGAAVIILFLGWVSVAGAAG